MLARLMKNKGVVYINKWLAMRPWTAGNAALSVYLVMLKHRSAIARKLQQPEGGGGVMLPPPPAPKFANLWCQDLSSLSRSREADSCPEWPLRCGK